MKEEMEKMSNEELQAIIVTAREIMAARGGKKMEVHLHSNVFKGSGKCWVAQIDEYKKILGFVEEHTTIRDGYKKEKIFFLPDGRYLLCEEGTKSYDDKKYITVKDGEEVEE